MFKNKVSPDYIHDYLVKNAKPKLAFDESKDFNTWRKQLKEKFEELLGIDQIRLNDCPINIQVESEEVKDGYRLIRFLLETEKDYIVPCNLLIPTTNKQKYPLAIVSQGHKKGGMYNSIGVVKTEEDKKYQPNGAFALQAVREGFATLTVELRGMGELEPDGEKRMWGGMCKYSAFVALALGRTLLGERAWDISKAIDAMSNFPEVDTSTIVVAGESGGGTASFYAGCFDERISLVVPVVSFCAYNKSILEMNHCICNLIPNVTKWFEMGDLTGLIAPRKFLAINGKLDEAFLIEGVREAFDITKRIYRKIGKEQNIRLVETPDGHRWIPEIVFSNIKEMLKI